MSKLRYYTWNDACSLPVVVDSLEYQYDVQNRMTGMNSRMLNFGLYYDGGNVNQGLSGAQVVQAGTNYNGTINGWRFDYDVAQYGVTGFNNATVYGFEYDGMNRMVRADASVLENNLQGSPSGFDAAATYGTTLSGTHAAWYGDARYEYDKVGNLTGLKRYNYFAPGTPPVGNVGDNWQYMYQGNRLTQLVTSGQAMANFTYDAVGNVTKDSRANITLSGLDHRDLPTGLIRNGDSTRYLYGQDDARIWKASGPDDYSYYLRDISGQQLAIWSQADTTWTFELYGLDLFAEYTFHADSTDSTARMINPNLGSDTRIEQWIRRGKIVVLGAVAGVMTGLTKGKEGRSAHQMRGFEMAIPLLAALVDLVADAVLPPPPSGGANERVHSAADGPDLKFLVKDHLGNVRVAYRALYTPDPNTGFCELDFEVAGVMDFFPYGKLLRAYFADGPERIQSTGHERDAESGWDFRGARLYSADYGRFLSVDPLAGGFPGWSPYNYVLGNLVSLIDPDGRSPEGGGGTIAPVDAEGTPHTWLPSVSITAKRPNTGPDWAKASIRVFASNETMPSGSYNGGGSGVGTIQWTAEAGEVVLDLIAMTVIPGLSQAAALGAAGLASYQRKYGSAGLSVATMIPGIGVYLGSAKWVKRARSFYVAYKLSKSGRKLLSKMDDLVALGKNLSKRTLVDAEADILTAGWKKNSKFTGSVTEYSTTIDNKKYILHWNRAGVDHSLDGKPTQYWKLFRDKKSTKKVVFRASPASNYKVGGQGTTYINGI